MTPQWRILFGSGLSLLIDAALTYVLIEFAELGPMVARIPALSTAIALAFIVDRGTFRHPFWEHSFRYWAVVTTSSAINVAIYAMLIFRAPQLQPLVAIVAAYMAATAYSLLGFSRMTFRR